jgi:hypothetical protein
LEEERESIIEIEEYSKSKSSVSSPKQRKKFHKNAEVGDY